MRTLGLRWFGLFILCLVSVPVVVSAGEPPTVAAVSPVATPSPAGAAALPQPVLCSAKTPPAGPDFLAWCCEPSGTCQQSSVMACIMAGGSSYGTQAQCQANCP
jgi:hypothetical protein